MSPLYPDARLAFEVGHGGDLGVPKVAPNCSMSRSARPTTPLVLRMSLTRSGFELFWGREGLHNDGPGAAQAGKWVGT